MRRGSTAQMTGAAALAGAVTIAAACGPTPAQGPGPQPSPVDLDIRTAFDAPPADARTLAIVDAATAFLATLSADQRENAVYGLDDNAQRSNWSNLPEGIVRRGGVRRGDMSEAQLAALDALLGEVMSADGVENIRYQLAAEDMLEGGPGRPDFGSDFYFVSFLGEPAADAPWMLQFGGHHLAINATFLGPDASFSPMLTGGQPLHITYDGQPVVITEAETAAAQALLDSLDEDQKTAAIRGDRAINMLLGPGAFGTTIAPEGVRGGDLSDAQQALLLTVVEKRLGFINADDFAAAMATIEAEIDETYFGWWGPQGVLGTAYYRVTAPSAVLEYAPQGFGGGAIDHAHSMYRNPRNDYGVAWIGAE